MPTTATIAAAAAEQRQPSRRPRPQYTPPGWLTAADLIQRGLFGSAASLDRACIRPATENPLPTPARDALTNARYWREQDIAVWVERERERIAGRLVLPGARPAVQGAAS